MKRRNILSKLKTFLGLLSRPIDMVAPLMSNGLLNWMSDEMFYKLVYKSRFGEYPDLNNPKTFNEKLQWLKLNCRNPEFTMMADKFRVREYISNTIGDEHLVPLLGVWYDVDDIDFSGLPDRFVLKCNHDQGSVIICKDKSQLDIKQIKKTLKKRMKQNHYYKIREWPYKNIKPCILCEKYMEDDSSMGELSDYKVLCFNGEPKLIEIHRGRFGDHTQDFYDEHWKKTKFIQQGTNISSDIIQKPIFADEMLRLSRILSKDMLHVRVDWYYTQGHLYFGELTFYDASGFDPFINYGQDLEIGTYLELPINKESGGT